MFPPESGAHARPSEAPAKLKLNKKFEPCAAETGDELFANGIFEFNISRLLAFIERHPQAFPVESVEVASLYRPSSDPADEQAIRTANLSRPIVLAEIARIATASSTGITAARGRDAKACPCCRRGAFTVRSTSPF